MGDPLDLDFSKKWLLRYEVIYTIWCGHTFATASNGVMEVPGLRLEEARLDVAALLSDVAPGTFASGTPA